jgi:ABC-type polysaccharide/polyol phosphate export permease
MRWALAVNEFGERLRLRGRRLASRSNGRALIELAWARLKVDDHNSILGMLWSLLGPAAMLIGLYYTLGMRFRSGIEAYPLYLILGVVLVSFFVTTTRYLISVFVISRDMFLNSTLPRESVVLSALTAHFYKLLVQLLLCVGVSIVYGLFSWGSVLLAIPLLVGYIALVLGVGLMLALVHSYARDVDHIWVTASPLLFIVTPVFYGLDSFAPTTRELLYWLNPLVPFLLAFRDALMGGGYGGWGAFWHSLLLGFATLAIGYSAFLSLEHAVVERA